MLHMFSSMFSTQRSEAISILLWGLALFLNLGTSYGFDPAQIMVRPAEETTKLIQQQFPGKHVLLFLGYSAKGYENPKLARQRIKEEIRNLIQKQGIQNVVIATGATEQGIGMVYEVAEELGVKKENLIGVVSEKALAYPDDLSKRLLPQNIFAVKDSTWGGYGVDAQGKKILNPTSQVNVEVAKSVVSLGGGEIAAAEIIEALKKDIPSTFYEMDMNHTLALAKVEKARKEGKRMEDPGAKALRGEASEALNDAKGIKKIGTWEAASLNTLLPQYFENSLKDLVPTLQSLNAFTNDLNHADPLRRQLALVGVIATKSNKALELLGKSLDDPDPLVRAIAARGLAIRPETNEIMQDLFKKALNSGDAYVQDQAAKALRARGDEKSLAILKNAFGGSAGASCDVKAMNELRGFL